MRQNRTKAQSAKIIGIEFWAERFSEHFMFIRDILKSENLGDTKLRTQLATMEARWAQISGNPLLFKPKDLEKTLELKHEVKHIVSSKPCLPDLLEHMIEEANYFKASIVDEKFTLKDEIHFWANEHAENLDFVDCQLPIFIEKEGHGRYPAFLKKAFKQNEELSSKLKGVASDNSEGFFSSIGKLFGYDNDNDRNRVEPEELDKVFKLFNTHIDGIKGLIAKVPELPLTQKTAGVLTQMLTHELNEAIFAEHRLRLYL